MKKLVSSILAINILFSSALWAQEVVQLPQISNIEQSEENPKEYTESSEEGGILSRFNLPSVFDNESDTIIPSLEIPQFSGLGVKGKTQNNDSEENENTIDVKSEPVEEQPQEEVQNETVPTKRTGAIFIPGPENQKQFVGGIKVESDEGEVKKPIVPPSYHPEMILLINSSMLPECAKIYAVDIALTNAAINKIKKIGRRDTVRALNTCVQNNMQDETLKGLAALSLVSLKSSTCVEGKCEPESYKMIADTVLKSQEHVMEILGSRFYDEIQKECLPGFPSDCVEIAAQNVNTRIDVSELEWAKLNEDNRVFGVYNEERDMIIENLGKFRYELNTIKSASREVFSNLGRYSTPVGESIALYLKNELDDEILVLPNGTIKIAIFKDTVELLGDGMFIRLRNEVSATQCKTLIQNYSRLGVNNLFVNGNIVPKDENKNNIFYCQSGNSNVIEIIY